MNLVPSCIMTTLVGLLDAVYSCIPQDLFLVLFHLGLEVNHTTVDLGRPVSILVK